MGRVQISEEGFLEQRRESGHYVLSLVIPWLPSSLNRMIRSHRFKNHHQNVVWDNYILGETQHKRPPQPITRARIRLVRHSYRMLAYDGLVGSMKPVVDAIVSARILKDDSWKTLGQWVVDQKFRHKKAGPLLEIYLEETPEHLS